MLASPYNCGRSGDALLLAVACCGVGASRTTFVVHDEVITSAACQNFEEDEQ